MAPSVLRSDRSPRRFVRRSTRAPSALTSELLGEREGRSITERPSLQQSRPALRFRRGSWMALYSTRSITNGQVLSGVRTFFVRTRLLLPLSVLLLLSCGGSAGPRQASQLPDFECP